MNRAYVEALLEGVALPASRAELVAHARREGAETAVVERLRLLPDRSFRSLDEVGEALEPVQFRRAADGAPPPRAESGPPPGGDAYTAA